MKILNKTIFTGFSPNLTWRDTKIACRYLFLPWRWMKIKNGIFAAQAEDKIKKYFNIKYADVFDSGRTSLEIALKILEIGGGDEVLVQAYTCVVVVNAIKWVGAKPIFVDVDDSFNMCPEDLAKKITSKSKALVIQHTFGMPAKLNELMTLAGKNNIKVIEDCAHSLGAKQEGKLTGTFGHIGMLSFGSDKVISCARGGALITNDDALGNKINKFKKNLPNLSACVIFKHLIHYPVFLVAKPIYDFFGIGKVVLFVFKKFNLTNKIIEQQEKDGSNPGYFPAKLPNSLAQMLANQLDEIDKINQHRQQICKLYNLKISNKKLTNPWKNIELVNCACLRYPILAEKANELLQYAKNRGVLLGDWYRSVIAPADIDLAKTGYQEGSCPKAEALAKKSLNLPADRQITSAQAEKIIKIINEF